MKSLLAVGTDSKTVKGEKQGVLTGILYMSPAIQSDGIDLCPFSTAECRSSCLNTAGRGAFSNVQAARMAKRELFLKDRASFLSILEADIARLERKAARLGMVPAVRLNGTTDIRWDKIAAPIMAEFPRVRFYDYTKRPTPAMGAALPNNYDVTYSHHGDWFATTAALAQGTRVAMVFNTKKGAPLPRALRLAGLSGTIPVIDGDESDARFMDARGVIVGLRAKGKAKGARGAFVVSEDSIHVRDAQTWEERNRAARAAVTIGA